MGFVFLKVQYDSYSVEGIEFVGPPRAIDKLRGSLSCGKKVFENTIEGNVYKFKSLSLKGKRGPGDISVASSAEVEEEGGRAHLLFHMFAQFEKFDALLDTHDDAIEIWHSTWFKYKHVMRKFNAGGLDLSQCLESETDGSICKHSPLYLRIAKGSEGLLECVDCYGEQGQIDFFLDSSRAKSISERPISGFNCGILAEYHPKPSFYGRLYLNHDFFLGTMAYVEPYSCLSALLSVEEIVPKDFKLENMVKACDKLSFVEDIPVIYREMGLGVVYCSIKQIGGDALAEHFNFSATNLVALKLIRKATCFDEANGELSINGETYWYKRHKEIRKENSYVILVVSRTIEGECWTVGRTIFDRIIFDPPPGNFHLLTSQDFKLHMQYSFIARGGGVILEAVDFTGSFRDLWDAKAKGHEWLKEDPQGRKEENAGTYCAILFRNNIGFFVSCSSVGECKHTLKGSMATHVFYYMEEFLMKLREEFLKSEAEAKEEPKGMKRTLYPKHEAICRVNKFGPKMQKVMKSYNNGWNEEYKEICRVYDKDSDDSDDMPPSLGEELFAGDESGSKSSSKSSTSSDAGYGKEDYEDYDEEFEGYGEEYKD